MGGTHRATLKQQNKGHHGAKKATKGRAVQSGSGISKQLGKVKAKNLGADLGKKDRRNLRQQLKGHAQAKQKRPTGKAAPKLVVVVSFHANANVAALEPFLGNAIGEPIFASQQPTRVFPGQSRDKFTLCVPERTLGQVLDACKCADAVIGCFPATASLESPPFDELGYRLLSAMKLQGLPPLIGCMPEEAMATPKVQGETRKLIERYCKSEVGTQLAQKLVKPSDLLRTLRSLSSAELTWRDGRGYLLADRVEYDAASRKLAICGFARGSGFSPAFRVHLTGLGDFQAESVSVVQPAQPSTVVEEVDPGAALEEEEKLRPFDPTAQEQTWPTAEELMKTTRLKVPKGCSKDETTVAWLGDVDDEMDEDDDEMEDEDEEWTRDLPVETAEEQFNKRKLEFEERKREDMDFPDEVDTPTDQPARIRFQKFRGLKSFVTSAWDPYEDLPLSYSRIWDFESVQATQKSGRDAVDARAGGEGEYLRIVLTEVPPMAHAGPLVASTVFPHELQVTVSHMKLNRCDSRQTEFEDSIKAKTVVEVMVGFRRMRVKPLFAEERKKNNEKLKFCRFFHSGSVIASFLGPALHTPAPVLAFTTGEPEGTPSGALFAWGTLLPPDPLKCIIKRSTLTGYPFKCHKTKATVRFMFFDPNDIRWFKPVELTTKKGLRGHVMCSLGTHGYMKCRFSGKLKNDDTVCMHLYKRVFPPWYPPTWDGRADMTVEDDN